MDELTDFLANLPPLRKPRQVKRKAVVQGRYDLKELYYDARRVMFEREYPAAHKANEYYDSAYPDVSVTNGTQNYIQDVLNNLGHQCERISTTGRRGKDGKWWYAGTTKGSSDLSAIIKIPSQSIPAAWKIEIKKGADDLNKSQVKYKKKVVGIGGLHSVVYVGDLDHFWDEYYRIIQL